MCPDDILNGICSPLDEPKARMYSPLTLAFLGDAVYSLLVRNMLSMQEEKEYYLYLDDLFGDDTQYASAELQIDLKKIQFIE